MLLSNPENPLQPPKDPPCCPPTSQISELINSSTNSNSPSGGRSSSDDVEGDDNKQLHIVDLFESDHHPPPKFSIRDYVFSTRRSKDIENNWPFSEENLQLCLKHGLKDLLPPFQPQESVRKLSSLHNSEGLNQNDLGVSVVNAHNNLAGCINQNIVVGDCLHTNPKGCQIEGGSKEFPSTITTSQTCSEITSVPTNRSPEFGTDNFQEITPPKAKKSGVVSKSQAQVKKCRLLVKLGNNSSNLTAKEDSLMISEAAAMASSKVCPVCKTFSSSSNTTLNAHIDQCLSGESTTTKWSLDTKVIKHKIKARKIKSMVEIYETALHCTLEELDRRNGTNWANTKSTLPAQENEAGSSTADQRKKQARWLSSPANSLEEIPPGEGAVYIDANGTKVRILSKSADPSLLSKAVDCDKVPPKKLNRDKVSKFILSKKKKQSQVQKRLKLMKYSKMASTFRPRLAPSKINDNQDQNFSREESFEEEARITQHSKSPNGIEISRRPDVVCGWVSSKRTGLTKKSSGGDDKDLSVEIDRFSLGNYNVKSSCRIGRRTSNTFENSVPPRNSKQTEKLAYVPHDDKNREMPSVRKRSRIDLEESPVSFGKEKTHAIKQSRKDKSHNEEDRVSLVCKRKVQVYAGEGRNVDQVVDPKNSCGQDMQSAKGKIFSSSRNKSSSGRASKPDSKMNFKRKFLPFEKSSVVGYDHARISILKTRKSWGEGVSARKAAPRTLQRSQSALMPYDAEELDGSFVQDSASESTYHHAESAGTNTDTSDEEDIDMEPPSGGAFRNFSDQLVSSSDLGCTSGRFSDEALDIEDEAPACSAELLFKGGEEMFSAGDEAVPENMNGVTEMVSSGTHGNYFVDVDPIPIPGPPGSFLPSPGRMDSEDLPGNSSWTSSRIQSSDDQQELVDQSSESPVSAISAISNSNLAKSDSKSSGTMVVGCPSQALDALGNGNVESSSSVLVDKTSTADGTEKSVLDKYNEIGLSSKDKVVYQYKDHHPPCCCSLKEGYSHNISLNFEESQLLKRRAMPVADVMAASQKEMTGDRPGMLSANGCNAGDSAVIQRIATDSSSLHRFPSGDAGCEPNSPAAPSPVLRLMGKNLMVVNKDDQGVVSSQIKPSQLSSITGHAIPSQVLPISGVPIVTQSPYLLELTARGNNVMQHHEWSDGCHTGHENVWTASQMPAVTLPSALSSSGALLGGLAGSSSTCHEYIHGYNLSSTEHWRPTLNGIVKPSANYDGDEHCRSPPSLRWKNAANSTPMNNAVKEIIVIDDSPENDQHGSLPAPTARNEGSIQDANFSSGSRPRPISLYGYPQYDSAATYCSGSPVDASFRIQSSNGINVNGSSPTKWMNWAAAEGSGAMHQSPLMATTSSSAATQLRPKFYSYSNLK